MKLIKTKISGCFELQPNVFDDVRGRFVKIFNLDDFKNFGLEVSFAEQYYSVSKKNVIRGMHFQLPPCDHAKLVCCLRGVVFDAVIDLRVGSPTYGHAETFELTADKANSIYIPKGMAHGFCTLSDEAVLMYNVSSVYSAECDSGIKWNSGGIAWPIQNPILSARDQGFLPLSQFISPFKNVI